jgi:protein SCO1/2
MTLRFRFLAFAAALLVFVGAEGAGAVERSESLPQQLEGVGVTEHRDAPVPLRLPFKNERGSDVTLADYFNGNRPVILTLNYYRCPMLCTLILNGLVGAVREVGWTPGREFEIVTVSFDPNETASLANAKKESYVGALGRPEAAKGWHFLTGRQSEIDALTRAVGFEYRYDADSNQFAHAAVLVLCTPEGRISRYLYGVQFEPRTLRLSLVEASEGRIGSPLDQVILYCYHYDPESRAYAPAAVRIMRAGGLLTILVLGSVLLVLWLRDVRRRRSA